MRWHYEGDRDLENGGTFYRFDGWERVAPTVTLRGNASLARYVRREFLNGRAA